jgi:hypothetical protein
MLDRVLAVSWAKAGGTERGPAARMYVSRVRLENIRGFSGRRNVDLTLTRPDGSHPGWTVLAGQNGSGKTSLPRAIGLTVSGPFIAPNLVPDFRTWTAVGQPGVPLNCSSQSRRR